MNMKKAILIFIFIILMLFGISCTYASENTTGGADLSAFENVDSVEVLADDVDFQGDSGTVNQTDDDYVTVEKNEKSDVLEASDLGDVQSGDVATQDDVLMSKMGDILCVAPEDVLGADDYVRISIRWDRGNPTMPDLMNVNFKISFLFVSESTYYYKLDYLFSTDSATIGDVYLVGESSISIATDISVRTAVEFSLPDAPHGSYRLNINYYGESHMSDSFELPYSVKGTVTSISTSNITYNGGNFSVSGTVKDTNGNAVDDGTVTVKIGSTTKTVLVTGGSWQTPAEFSSTAYGMTSQTITATYSGVSGQYKTSSITGTLTINKMAPEVIVTGNPNFKYNINMGQIINGHISNSLGGQYGGYINITIGNVLVKSNLAVNADGSWSFTNYDTGVFLPNYTPYTITVSYSGNEYNDAGTGTGTYTVNWGDSIPIVVSGGDINVGDNKTVKVTVRDSKGLVQGLTVILNGTGLPGTGLSLITDSDGTAVFNVSDLAKGYYDDWMIILQEDEKYIPLFNQTVDPFYVMDALNIIITNVDSYNSTYPKNIVITGKTNVDDNSVGSINLTLGDKTVNAPLNDGVFTAIFTGVVPGKYTTLKAVFILNDSDHWYGGHVQDVQLNITVLPNSEINFIDNYYDVASPSIVNVSSNMNGRVLMVYLDGKYYGNISLQNNRSLIDLGVLTAGNHIVTLKFEGDESFTKICESHAIFVEKFDVKMSLSAHDIYFDEAVVVNVKSNVAKGIMTVYVGDNKQSIILDDNGKGTLTFNGLNAGVYAVIGFLIDGNHDSTSNTKSLVITVNKEITKFKVKKIYKFKSSKKTKKIKITVKNSKGRAVKNIKVTLNLKKVKGKKSFTVKTNKKGVAIFKVKSKFTKKGKYTGTVKFNGNKNFKSASKKIKIQIK